MAYEYEKSNKQIVYTVDNESSMDKLNERINELQEVYLKAKAFDEILNLLKTRHIQCADDNLEDIEIIINEYKEDTQNDS